MELLYQPPRRLPYSQFGPQFVEQIAALLGGGAQLPCRPLRVGRMAASLEKRERGAGAAERGEEMGAAVFAGEGGRLTVQKPNE